MDLNTIQLIFYTLGSIFFISLIILIFFMLVILFVVKRKITKVNKNVSKKLNYARELYNNKEKYILRLMGKGSSSLIETISKIFVKNQK